MSLDELEQVQAECCRYLQTHPELIRAQTHFNSRSCPWLLMYDIISLGILGSILVQE